MRRRKGLEEEEEEAPLIFQPFHRFTHVTTHSPHYSTLPSLHLRHSSLSNPSVASPTSQLALQHFCRFTYITCTSPTSPCEQPMGQTPPPWSQILDMPLILNKFTHLTSACCVSTECLKFMYTLFETLFLSNEMRQKYNLCCV